MQENRPKSASNQTEVTQSTRNCN